MDVQSSRWEPGFSVSSVRSTVTPCWGSFLAPTYHSDIKGKVLLGETGSSFADMARTAPLGGLWMVRENLGNNRTGNGFIF